MQSSYKNRKNSLELQAYYRQKPSQKSFKRNILFVKFEAFKDVNLATYMRHRKKILKNKPEGTGVFNSSS